MSDDIKISLRKNEKLSVLVVDDEEDIRETLITFLELMEVFTFIVEAGDGIEGMNKYQMQKFDLIITDLNMPKVTGLEFIENIKNVEKNDSTKGSTPIIILSANITGEGVKHAVSMGVKYALTKPCTATDFVEKVSQVLRKEKREKILVTK